MAVNMMDAKITVRLNLEDAEKQLDTLEKRTKKERDKEAKAERDSRRPGKKKPPGKDGGGLSGAIQTVAGFRMASLASKLRTALGVGGVVALLEAADRLEGTLEGFGVTKELQGAAVGGMSDVIIRKIFGKGWVDLFRDTKDEVAGLAAAVKQSQDMIRALAVSGLETTPESAKEYFLQTRAWQKEQARFRRNVRLFEDYWGAAALRRLGEKIGDSWR